MKKVFFCAAVAAMALVSCKSTSYTASTESVCTSISNRSYADLKVSDEVISFRYNAPKEVRKLGANNMKRAAVNQACAANKCDIIVSPEFEVGTDYVVVRGHAATYKNVHNMTAAEAGIVNAVAPCRK